ncbi:MAG: hypothetical protein FWF10_05170 [Clostridiales bacterium]|nr:hypothetical protein [Clostridiales bacterium]
MQSTTPLRRKIDRFWAGLFLTPEGRPKSAKLLYAFCLSIVFVLIYGFCWWFLVGDPLEQALSGMPAFVQKLVPAILPGLAGSIPCCAFWFVLKDKSYLPFIYGWLAVFALAVLLTLLSLMERELLGMMLLLYAQVVLPGLLIGSAFSWGMYVRWRRRRPTPETDAAD